MRGAKNSRFCLHPELQINKICFCRQVYETEFSMQSFLPVSCNDMAQLHETVFLDQNFLSVKGYDMVLMNEKQSNEQKERDWDKLLHIKTMGRDDSNADQYRYPYEPTPYSVLERLANTGLIRKGSTILDYGCGKGRVDFFLSYQTRCRSIGVEYDERIYEKAMENRHTAVSAGKVSFELANAEIFPVPAAVNCAYFFNPFSVTLLQSVISRVLDSYYASPRHMLLFFYYPSDEYISYLMSVNELLFFDEISCMDLFPGNDPRERIVIFELGE